VAGLPKQTKIAVLGAGAMGAGIAQVAAEYGHPTVLFDIHPPALASARDGLAKVMSRLVEKGKRTEAEAIALQARMEYAGTLDACGDAGLIIEAVVEDLTIKQQIFSELSDLVAPDCILASNTSSLAITAIAAAAKWPERVLGAHFFNPAPLMPLVEIVPGIASGADQVALTKDTITAWGKTCVLAKDTPGFIVNRVARPFYGEALRLLEEGVADPVTIDWAMREIGGFRMGPFQLMDFIGNDINYTVTETVFKEFFYDPRYKPSFTQKRMVEAGRLGRKSGRGYYDYAPGASEPEPNRDSQLGEAIFSRILVMLINEAIDAVFLNIATPEDIERAMTTGVNNPKGLLQWAQQRGLANVLAQLEALQVEYGEDRYRPSPLLRRMVRENRSFFP